MKSSISMKFWKTTISLSALLFLTFALTVLSWPFIGVSIPSSSSSPASPVNGSITYDKGANVIAVTGYSSRTPCTFTDIYNADVAGGWGVVHLQGTTQFKIDAVLYIGDGSTATTFGDTAKQVTFTAQSGSIIVAVYDNATVTFGQLLDLTTKDVANGVQFISTVASAGTYWFASQTTSAKLYCYGCSFIATSATHYIKNAANNGSRFYHCSLLKNCSFIQITNSDVFNIIIMNNTFGIMDSWGTFNKITIGDCTYALYAYGALGSTYRNVYARRSTYLWDGSDTTVDSYVINVDSDTWAIIWGGTCTGKLYRQNTFDLKVTDKDNNAINGAAVKLVDKNGTSIFSVTTNASGDIATQTVSRGYYDQVHGDTLQEYSPHTLTIVKLGYQAYTRNFTLSQKANWTIPLQPLTDGDLIEHVGFVPVDPGLTSPSGTYRWLDVADQAYGIGYRNNYNYSQAVVEVAYCTEGNELQGLLKARNLKPNFAYQLKLVGTPGTDDNERIGLAGRWWQEEWTGTTWASGQNLNDKGDGSSPNPNDQTYLSRRYIQDSSSPTGYHYRYTGYLVFNYFITNSNGTTTLQFETGSCYHVIWKTTQRSNATNDGPVKTVTFDPAPSQPAYDTDYPSNTVYIFGEWERLPMGQVNLQPGEYNCQILLTEESFHGSGGTLAGNWAGAVTANIMFTIN